jgi:hypothetical protein
VQDPLRRFSFAQLPQAALGSAAALAPADSYAEFSRCRNMPAPVPPACNAKSGSLNKKLAFRVALDPRTVELGMAGNSLKMVQCLHWRRSARAMSLKKTWTWPVSWTIGTITSSCVAKVLQKC